MRYSCYSQLTFWSLNFLNSPPRLALLTNLFFYKYIPSLQDAPLRVCPSFCLSTQQAFRAPWVSILHLLFISHHFTHLSTHLLLNKYLCNKEYIVQHALQKSTPFIPQQPCEVCTIMVPILPTRELRHREMGYLGQGHTVSKWWQQKGNPMAHLPIHPLDLSRPPLSRLSNKRLTFTLMFFVFCFLFYWKVHQHLALIPT